MERFVLRDLTEWKNSTDRKPLLITGVRQCGKTYVLKQFGEQQFDDLAYFNFEDNTSLLAVFEHDFDVDRILDELGNIIRGREIIPGKTLLVFDEIQICSRAITSLKYFCENKRDLHVIAAGSLLGVALKREAVSFPVGKVDRIEMYPMSFKEFLYAEGKEKICVGLQRYDREEALSALYTEELIKELRYFYAVGGMPEAVEKWVSTHNIEAVEKIQDNIIKDYEADFAKHAPEKDIPKLGWIWDSIPAQLAKDNKKFVFSHVRAGKRSAELEDALTWLVDAGIIYKHDLVEHAKIPLTAYANSSFFKVYMCDIGLLRAKTKISSHVLIREEDGIGTFKGAFVENYCLTELKKLGIDPFYWQSGNTSELDFIFEDRGRVIPMEAKAEIHTRAKSYQLFCKKYEPEIGFRVSMKNIGSNKTANTKTFSLPLYLLWRIKDYICSE